MPTRLNNASEHDFRSVVLFSSSVEIEAWNKVRHSNIKLSLAQSMTTDAAIELWKEHMDKVLAGIGQTTRLLWILPKYASASFTST